MGLSQEQATRDRVRPEGTSEKSTYLYDEGTKEDFRELAQQRSCRRKGDERCHTSDATPREHVPTRVLRNPIHPPFKGLQEGRTNFEYTHLHSDSRAANQALIKEKTS